MAHRWPRRWPWVPRSSSFGPGHPATALLLGEILSETDLPAGMWSVLPLANEQTAALVADPRLPVVSFTGSETVGYHIQSSQPTKHVILNSAGTPPRSSCRTGPATPTSIGGDPHRHVRQLPGRTILRVRAEGPRRRVVVRALRAALVEKMNALKTGSPLDPDVAVGPVINEASAERIASWIDDAVASGAELLAGGTWEGTSVAPTLLANAPAQAKVSCEEVFGPVMTIAPVAGVDAALAAVNDSRFGLQAGLFTRDLQVAFRAHRELLVGGWSSATCRPSAPIRCRTAGQVVWARPGRFAGGDDRPDPRPGHGADGVGSAGTTFGRIGRCVDSAGVGIGTRVEIGTGIASPRWSVPPDVSQSSKLGPCLSAVALRSARL